MTLETSKRHQLKTLVDFECIQHIKQGFIDTTVTRELIFGNIWQFLLGFFRGAFRTLKRSFLKKKIISG